jgi:hypothetical protein
MQGLAAAERMSTQQPSNERVENLNFENQKAQGNGAKQRQKLLLLSPVDFRHSP